jgi:7,8-dihydropterin-6-yl-methyl-4-(beta-D-ribofuranosyl)aminobenzene 5'-phosphate synthase
MRYNISLFGHRIITSMKKRAFGFLLLQGLFLILACGQEYRYLDEKSGLKDVTAKSGIENPVTIKVIYDNYVHTAGLTSDWGYSILIDGLENVILFDTGTNPDLFESNFRKMDLDASKIDKLVLSHEHGDHTGGIPAFVKMKNNIPVIITQSFSGDFKRRMTGFNLEPLLVNKPAMICKNLYTSGEFAGPISEQALVLNTKKGLVVMTGCSHPGIIEMLKEIRSVFNKDIYMVFGGFHLMQKKDTEVEKIIAEMKQLGVVKCGATHCTGDMQIQLFRESFGSDFVELGVGNSIIIE